MQTHPNPAWALEQCARERIGRLPADMACANDAEASVCACPKQHPTPRGALHQHCSSAVSQLLTSQGRMTPFRNFRRALTRPPKHCSSASKFGESAAPPPLETQIWDGARFSWKFRDLEALYRSSLCVEKQKSDFEMPAFFFPAPAPAPFREALRRVILTLARRRQPASVLSMRNSPSKGQGEHRPKRALPVKMPLLSAGQSHKCFRSGWPGSS